VIFVTQESRPGLKSQKRLVALFSGGQFKGYMHFRLEDLADPSIPM
jgi:hypothetical protein